MQMKRIEFVTLFIILALIVFRVSAGMQLHVLLRVFLVLIAIFYMWSGFFLFTGMSLKDLFNERKRNELSPKKVTSSITAGFIYSLSFIAIIHSIDLYRGMHILAGIAFSLNLLVVGFIVFLWTRKKENNKFTQQFFIRSSILVVFFAFVILTSVETKLNLLYKDHPRFIEAYTEYIENPEDPEKLNVLREERSAFR
ncbi:MAG: hypothetical protein ABR597_09570 [Bacteroidales bacterium]